ncbi:protein E6-like [Raphanus sativus]|uniref:Protein E6-like n=1 Tax=Raphanus sativus TaxID=3726 RepID=A0A9W3C7J1_RAPSA|nr:protein E6-like [Raphanus sativus]
MAFSTRTSSLFFFFFFFFFFTTLVLLSTQINARDSNFFGKFHRESSKDQSPNNVLPLKTSQKTTVEESFPNKKDQEQDPTFVPESENGYGLYGHETTYNNNKEEFNNNKYDEKFNGETFSTPRLSETEESYNNYDEKYPKKTESYDNKEEFNQKYDENVKEESFSENNEDKRSFYNSNAYGTELERETPYKGYSHNMERQGMSDTRFMEKGNYYYDLYNDRNHGHFYRKPHQKSPAGYYSSQATENNYDQSYNNYNNEEEKSFKDPYNSKWEKNMMNEQPEEFDEEQGDQFKP